MSRVITFSTNFQKNHPRQGEPTYFVEKFYNSLFSKNNLMEYPKGLEINDSILETKGHTIRSGNRWKEGQYFSPRIWSATPYRSPQIIFAPDTKILKVYDFKFFIDEIRRRVMFSINGDSADSDYRKGIHVNYKLKELAKNDGLQIDDFMDWFQYPKPFEGQIICWSSAINYDNWLNNH